MVRKTIHTLLLCCVLFGCQQATAQSDNAGVQTKATKSRSHKATAHRVPPLYNSMLKIWCDGLLSLQVKGGTDDGGIYSPSHGFVNGRCGDAVYPLLTLYDLTKQTKYKSAALRVYQWSERHVSQPDGSWINETDGKNNWKGITCFSVIALGEALRHHGNALTATEKTQWQSRLRKGGDYLLASFTFETGDINYAFSAAAALAVCWSVLADEKYGARAKEFAAFSMQHFTQNNLVWGEGIRGSADTTAKGLRPIDVPYNMEESLPNLALYANLTGDEKARQAALTSMQAHLDWMLPDGAWDAGWCGRQYKWTYYGSATTDGPLGGFALLQNLDKRFSEAAYRSLRLRQSYTHGGLLHGGRDLQRRKIPVFAHHTISNAKGLAAAIDAGIKAPTSAALPNDTAYGVRVWAEADVLQIGMGPWRASITTNDLASSPKRGGHPMGGALTMLWHKAAGPVAVASMNDYRRYEATNMQPLSKVQDAVPLTPRLEVVKNGIRYSNVYDAGATMRWSNHKDSVVVVVAGNLCDSSGKRLTETPSPFTIRYVFGAGIFRMEAHADAVGTELILPVVSSRKEFTKTSEKGATLLQNLPSAFTYKLSGIKSGGAMQPQPVFNFVPGFEAVMFRNVADSAGNFFVEIKDRK